MVASGRRRRSNLLQKAIKERPASSATRVVLPWDYEGKHFRKDEYNPIQTEGRMTTSDLENSIEQLKQSKHYKPDNFTWIMCIGIAVMLVSTAAYIIIMITGFSKGNNDGDDSSNYNGTKDLSPLWYGLGVMFISLILLFTIMYIHHQKFKKGLLEREEDFKKIVEKENNRFYKAKDIRLTAGKFGAWLTLELDYIARGMNHISNQNQYQSFSVARPSNGGGAFQPAYLPTIENKNLNNNQQRDKLSYA